MKALVLALAGSFACFGAAYAQSDAVCVETAALAAPESPLAYAATAMAKNRRLRIVVDGTTSSLPPNPADPASGYPARLEAELSRRLAGVDVKLINEAKPRQSAADMAATFPRILLNDQPDLIIWQTGTFDAIQGINSDDYLAALDKGIEDLHAAQVDVILVSMQYSPRTESMIAAGSYADNMRLAAVNRAVPLFDRFAIMREWNDAGTFDLYASTKDAAIAERVHRCIGLLLADFTLEAMKLAEPAKETR